MSVVLTGAAGRIGTALRERLPGYGWSLRSFDRVAVGGASAGDVTSGDMTLGDIASAADLDAVLPGATAVVHLAGIGTEAPWPLLREVNIEGTLQVFEAARRHGVPRVVYASSIHTVGFAPAADELSTSEPARPDTLYGVSKVFGEALGRYYAERYGLQVACLRIGTFAPTPPDRGALANWLSPDDCAQLVDACLRSPELSFATLWGISANTRRTWPLDDALALGYRPRDDAEDYVGSLAKRPSYPSDALVGGGFTSPGFGIDEVAARA